MHHPGQSQDKQQPSSEQKSADPQEFKEQALVVLGALLILFLGIGLI